MASFSIAYTCHPSGAKRVARAAAKVESIKKYTTHFVLYYKMKMYEYYILFGVLYYTKCTEWNRMEYFNIMYTYYWICMDKKRIEKYSNIMTLIGYLLLITRINNQIDYRFPNKSV